MSALQDPPRLAEAEDVPAGLKNLMEDSHKDVLSQAQVLAIASAVSRATAGASLAPVALKTGGGSFFKWLGGAVIVGLIGGGAYLGLQRGPAPAERVSSPAVVAPPAEPVASVAPVEAPAASAAVEEAPKPRVVTPAAPAAPKVDAPSSLEARSAVEAPSAKAQLLEESRLLSAARAALATDPKKALALTEQHRAKFPQGTLAQEREVIAIQALGKLGNKKDADQRADQFGKDYPDSAHKDRVQGKLGDKP
ncbi:MAG: hypothetical protein H6718_00870 [Polyangiaceae bacterium]|nr:hypothetical protein [Myxococcales bacterium]MCB9583915.1 hypothetical protein [Polyangiaceae bacterium]MCB9607829.1 hypothetical protein [Polyangiaceae bacterium]